MFGRKNKIDVQELGITLHKLVIQEVFRFLERAGKKTLKFFNLNREDFGEELIWLSQFAAWSVLKKLFPDENEDIIAAMHQAYYDDLIKDGITQDELTELDSYLQKRFLVLSLAEAKLPEDKFNEELGKMSAISVSKKDSPPEDLSPIISIYYAGICAQIGAFLSTVQLKET